MLSPDQYRQVEQEIWDVKGLGKKTLPVATDNWIPYIADNIPLMRWKHVWLVDNIDYQHSLILRSESLKQSGAFVVSSAVYNNILKDKWPFVPLFDMEDTILVHSKSSQFDPAWVDSIQNAVCPWVWIVPDGNVPDVFSLWKLYRIASIDAKVLPEYEHDVGMIRLYAYSMQDVDNFQRYIKEDTFVTDLHQVDIIKIATHRIPVARSWVYIQAGDDIPNRTLKPPSVSWTTTPKEDRLQHLKEFYRDLGF
jgi:hypothetical protein